jgi:hypothetical protein
MREGMAALASMCRNILISLNPPWDVYRLHFRERKGLFQAGFLCSHNSINSHEYLSNFFLA